MKRALLLLFILLLAVCLPACSGKKGENSQSLLSSDKAAGASSNLDSALSDHLKGCWEEYLQSSKETGAYFVPADYDGDGIQEAFGVTGVLDGFGGYDNVKIYYIAADGSVTCVREKTKNGDALYGYLMSRTNEVSGTEADYLLPASDAKFLVWEISAHGSGSLSVILGVKNGEVYEPDISEQYMGFKQGDEGQFIGYTSDFSQGFHDYIEHPFRFDGQTGQFIET